FTQAWLEALRGEAPDLLYEETPRGRVLALAGLQRIVDASVLRHAREAGVRQKVEFPRLEGRVALSEPLFVPVREPVKTGQELKRCDDSRVGFLFSAPWHGPN